MRAISVFQLIYPATVPVVWLEENLIARWKKRKKLFAFTKETPFTVCNRYRCIALISIFFYFSREKNKYILSLWIVYDHQFKSTWQLHNDSWHLHSYLTTPSTPKLSHISLKMLMSFSPINLYTLKIKQNVWLTF